MSEFIHKSHNVSVLIYHIVCPAKYRKVVITKEVDEAIKQICLEIEDRYEIKFLEIGTEKNHVHFLVQAVPMMSPKQVIQIIKSITAREVFKRRPEVKKILWGGEFWTSGYYVGSVGKYGNEDTIMEYVKNQGRDPKEYEQLYENRQLKLFE
jgi:putative transposase